MFPTAIPATLPALSVTVRALESAESSTVSAVFPETLPIVTFARMNCALEADPVVPVVADELD